MSYAERALAADAHNFAAQKWTGVLISWSSEFQGYKRKIERSYEIKDHFLVRIVRMCVWRGQILVCQSVWVDGRMSCVRGGRRERDGVYTRV